MMLMNVPGHESERTCAVGVFLRKVSVFNSFKEKKIPSNYVVNFLNSASHSNSYAPEPQRSIFFYCSSALRDLSVQSQMH